MDLLLDKADQPYFTTPEKDRFLKIAISDFVNFHYQKMLVDEDSRRALAPLIDWNVFSLSASDIVSGAYIFNNVYPAFSEKYQETGIFDQAGVVIPNSTHTPANPSDRIGFWKYGNQYMLPKQHLYVISMATKTYNRDDIIDLSTGLPFPGITSSDVIISDATPVKNKSTRDFYEDAYGEDPFNNPDKQKGKSWQYMENRINISGGSNLSNINIQTITLPTIERAFGSVQDGNDTWGLTTLPKARVFTDHYQQQIIELAVDKMTKVDVGLMTPPS